MFKFGLIMDYSNSVFLLDLFGKNDQKSILIQEYQHKSTRVNTNQHEFDTNQHESDTSQQESTRINTCPTRVNTSPTRFNTNQHECKTSLDHKK